MSTATTNSRLTSAQARQLYEIKAVQKDLGLSYEYNGDDEKLAEDIEKALLNKEGLYIRRLPQEAPADFKKLLNVLKSDRDLLVQVLSV